jgi:N-methylhydantoinase B
MFANMACQSVEVIEAENPLQVRAFEFLTDRAGAGKYRGGAPYRRTYRFMEEEGVLQVRSDRAAVRPYGLYGGRAGEPSRNVLNPQSDAQPLESKLLMTLHRDDVFSHELPGGGGWGDPLERAPDAVLADVRNGFVSAAAARTQYAVVIDEDAMVVDGAATQALRAQPRGERAAQTVSWE